MERRHYTAKQRFIFETGEMIRTFYLPAEMPYNPVKGGGCHEKENAESLCETESERTEGAA